MKKTRVFFAGALLSAVCVSVAACSADEQSGGSDLAASKPDSLTLLLEAVPHEARVAIGAGEPRSSGYWVMWSSCGEGSRAETAAASGGREAGWLLMDDLLKDPGISLGVWAVNTCQDAVAVLQGDRSDPLTGMARQLLTAELNLAAGSGTCEATRELVLAGHALLTRAEYDGSSMEANGLEDGAAESMRRAATLLSLYNAGRLCR